MAKINPNNKVKKVLETKFTPQKIEEHLQLLSVWYWMIIIYFLAPVTTFILIYIGFLTSYYPIVFFYLLWAYYDKGTPHSGGRSDRYKFMRSFLAWKYFNTYFPVKVVKMADLIPEKNYLFCYYPHGVMPVGLCGVFGNNFSDFNMLYPGLKPHTANVDMMFHLPLLREHIMAIGGISCSKQSLRYVLNSKTKGNVVVLSIGGASESLYATPGPYRIVLKSRKGFVKIALETGAALVPVFSFGEIDIFKQNNPAGSKWLSFQLWFKRIIGIAPVIVHGRGIFSSNGIAPFKKPITVVVGKPIEHQRIDSPTTEDIEKYHSLFSEALVELFNEHKSKYAEDGDKSELIIE